VEIKAVPPVWAKARSRSLSSRADLGSSPTIGSSITNTVGLCTSAAEMISF
jgi:hypothetical protein